MFKTPHQSFGGDAPLPACTGSVGHGSSSKAAQALSERRPVEFDRRERPRGNGRSEPRRASDAVGCAPDGMPSDGRGDHGGAPQQAS